MNVSILCTDLNHPVNSYLAAWIEQISNLFNVELLRSREDLTSGDFLFLISCSELINEVERAAYTHTLVLHASDLPTGRGWSPHVWEIIQGASQITLSLIEANQKVDSGRIWLKKIIHVPSDALWNEINHLLFQAEIELMNQALMCHKEIKPYPQRSDIEPTYHRKRTMKDSLIDPNLTISEQFNLIRICDPNRYPAWFELNGHQYKLKLEKI